MGSGPLTTLTAPSAAPPVVGLLASARDPFSTREGVLDLATGSRVAPDGRWRNGFEYNPELAGVGYITSQCDPQAGDRAIDARLGNAEWEPYVIGDGIACSTFGWRGRDWRAQVTRQLNSIAEYQISYEFWHGVIAQRDGLANGWLANAATSDDLTEGTAVPLTHGLACLQQYLADMGGQRGMIHASRQVITHWLSLNLVERRGAVQFDPFDNIIVPGAGYDGSTPDGAGPSDGDVWAYATGIVDVFRGPIDYSGVPEDTPEQIGRSTNDIEIRAEQDAVASWDGRVHGAVRLDVDVCAIGGS